jgi:hypothetical protein
MTIAKLYGNFLVKALNAEINWNTHDIRVRLCTALTIDQDGDIYLADVVYTECSATGNYTAGGKALTFTGATAISYNATNNTITLDADNVVWDSSTITANYAIIYDNTPAINKPVIGYVDFEGAVSSSNGAFTIAWNASGIATINVS